MPQHAQSQSRQDYTIGWICVLEPEYVAARAMLDHTNEEKLPAVEGDSNNYTFGQIGKHNVVIASLPSGTYGTNSAAVVATQMARSFPDLRFILLVGIGGGVPQMTSDPDEDIHLGDVVVSNPTEKSGGVIQYDLGRMHEGAPRPTHIWTLNKPPQRVLTAVASLKSSHRLKSSPLEDHLLKMAEQHPSLVPKYQYQGTANDVLFDAGYRHEGNSSACDKCLQSRVVQRPPRETTQPRIHYGAIASGNQVVKDSVTREFWRKEAEVLCFEMEAAGLMDPFPCLVIRGICDYVDSHKNQKWQSYAAATAAAYAKDLLLEIAPIAVQTAETSLRGNHHWMVPRNVNRHFTGRSEILERLRLAFFSESEVQKTYVIAGAGGIGKSEVCLNFAHKYRQRFWGIFWIDASSRSSAQQAFLDVAKLCGVNLETLEQVRTWLSNAQQSWLLVLDNADDPRMDYAEFFPTGRNGNVLLTTRNPHCIDTYATVGSETLDYLGLEDAIELLFKAAAVTQWKDQHKAAARVVQDLGFHTLAIIQAGAYIQHRHSSFEDYLNLFKQQQHQLLSYNLTQAQSTHGSVFATFEISAIHMQSSDNQAAINALCLLRILSFLHPHEISESIFSRAWDEVVSSVGRTDEEWSLNDSRRMSEVDLSQLPWLMKRNKNVVINCVAWRESVDLLESYSLIKVSGKTANLSFSMHPLAHLWSRVRLQLDCQRKAWRATGSIIVFSMQSINYHSFVEKLRLHAQAYLDHPIVEYMERIPHKELCQTFIYLCWLLVRLNEDSKLAYLLRDLNKFEGWTCAPEIYSLDAQELAAISFQRQRQYRKAVHLLEHVVQRRITLLKPEDSCLLDSQHNLALAYKDLGHIKKAEELLEYIIKIQQRSLKPDHDKLLRYQYGLAIAYQSTGRVEKAIEVLEHVVGIRERLLDPQHPSLLKSQYELARSYHKDGQVKRAIKLLENVVQIEATILKPKDPDRLTSEHELAKAYHANGQVKRAIELLENVVKIQATTLKPEDRGRLVSEHELARAYHANGQVKSAIELLEKVVKIRATTLKLEHPDRLGSEHELAVAYHKDGQVKRAIKLLENVVQIKATILKPEDRNYLVSEHELARAYHTNRQVKSAIELLEKVVKIKATTLKSEDRDRLVSEYALAIALFSNGEASEAVELLEKAVEISKRVLEPQDPFLVRSRDSLAEVYRSMKIEEEGQSSASLHLAPSLLAKASRRDPSPVQSKNDNEACVPSHSLRTIRARTKRGKLLDKEADIEESEHEKPRLGEPAATRGSRRGQGSDKGGISAARGRKGGRKRQASVDLTVVASKRGRRH